MPKGFFNAIPRGGLRRNDPAGHAFGVKRQGNSENEKQPDESEKPPGRIRQLVPALGLPLSPDYS